MRILFTGGSSFTGFWFIRELAAAGHRVTATFRRRPEDYLDPLRRRRVMLASEFCRPIYEVSFGDPRFLALAGEGVWDLLAHHAADVTDYKSPDFDVAGALQANTRSLAEILDALRAGGCRKVILTGSVFEGGEGAGSRDLLHFSPYGLSKALTAQVFRYRCAQAGLSLGKFVIPNPFGPWEEPRYTAYLLKSWLEDKTPSCLNPLYVRDNIHVSLLARAYLGFAEALGTAPGFARFNPSGYVETQGAFTLRLAEEMSRRLGRPCPVELKSQTEFPEPLVRINTDVLDARAMGWNEAEAWDEMARYYREPRGV
jgi:UDP-glucose 4-epimerase